MKRVAHCVRVVIVLALLAWAIPVRADQAAPTVPDQGDVWIVEVQTGSKTSASEEFVEIFNASAKPIDVSQWRMEYFSASSANFDGSPTRAVILHGVLESGKRYMIASTGYQTTLAYDSFSAGLAAGGGHLRLVSADATGAVVTHDLVGWGTALHPEGGHAAAASAAGQSTRRVTDAEGYFLDSDDNLQDFQINAAPNPATDNLTTVALDTTTDPPVETPDDSGNTVTPPVSTGDTGDTPTPTPTPVPDTSSGDDLPLPDLPDDPVVIDELLPNPAAPQTDANDEFVELYNPNATAVDLSQYKLQTGLTFSHNVLLTGRTILPHAYLAIFSGDTGLTLSNTGGNARLLDPTGEVMSEIPPYDAAASGQAFILFNDVWQWSTTPTPNAVNVLSEPAAEQPKVAATATKAPAKKAATSTKAKATPTPKKTAVKAASTKKSTVKTPAAVASSGSGGDTSAPSSSVHPMILAGVGALAVGYGAYEYREDIFNKYRKYRADRKRGRVGRAIA